MRKARYAIEKARAQKLKEEKLARLEVDEARRVIAGIAADPPPAAEPKKATEDPPRRTLRSASAGEAPRALAAASEAQTKKARAPTKKRGTGGEAREGTKKRGTLAAEGNLRDVSPPPRPRRRRPYVAPPRFARVPDFSKRRELPLPPAAYDETVLSTRAAETSAPEPNSDASASASAASAGRVARTRLLRDIYGEDGSRDESPRSAAEAEPAEPAETTRGSGGSRAATDTKTKKPRVSVVDDDDGRRDAPREGEKAPSKRKRRAGERRSGERREREKARKPRKPRDKKPRDPAAPLTMAPAPRGSIFSPGAKPDGSVVSLAERRRKDAERARFEAKRYRCAVFECDREPVGDFFVTRHGDSGEVRESRFCEIALGVTPERLLRLRGTQPGAYFFKGEKARALAASLSAFSDCDATDEEATSFAAAFAEQGGMVIRHFLPPERRDAPESARGKETRETDGGVGGTRASGSDGDRADPAGSRRGAKEKPGTCGGHVSVPSSTPATLDTWTTWSGRRTTVKSVPLTSSRPRHRKPAPDIGPWLAALRRAHKGESISPACAYVSQRVRPLFAARRAAPPRLPRDSTGNPAERHSEKKDAGASTACEPYYDSDDDAVAPSQTLGLVEVTSRSFTDPAELLATPTEVAYLGVKPAPGSGLPLYAAHGDAERLNAKKTPTFSSLNDDAKRREDEATFEDETAFYASVVSLDDVLFDAVSQGSEMMRDMRLAERETFALMHNRSGMPLRFRYLEMDVALSQEKLLLASEMRRGGGAGAGETGAEEAGPGAGETRTDNQSESERKKNATRSRRRARGRFADPLRFFGDGAGPNETARKWDEPNHAWDPRAIASRPGNVASFVVTETVRKDVREDAKRENDDVADASLKETGVAAPSLRFFAAGSAVPLRCLRPLALSEIAFATGGSKKPKKRVYQTDTTSKKVLDATGFVWYTVPRCDVPKLVEYVREMAKEAGSGAFGGGEETFLPAGGSSAAARAPGVRTGTQSLLDADSPDLRSPGLWLDPGALAKWNASRTQKAQRIVVQRHVQRAGEHFARAPGAARWGVCVGGCWLAESPFAFPEDYAQLARSASALEREAAFEAETKTSKKPNPKKTETVRAGSRSFAVPASGAESGRAPFFKDEALLEAAARGARGDDRRLRDTLLYRQTV